MSTYIPESVKDQIEACDRHRYCYCYCSTLNNNELAHGQDSGKVRIVVE